VDPLTKPAWVIRLLGDSRAKTYSCSRGESQVEVVDAGRFSHVQVVVPDALELAPTEFQHEVTAAYSTLFEHLASCRASDPLRFWNFVPGIHQSAGRGLDRYELFNVGRFLAFSRQYGTSSFGRQMIAASGIDGRSRDFIVQALAGDQPGLGIENPRQCPAYRYSHRYGPLPPCFARATMVPATQDLCSFVIIAGTASIVGEDSRHPGDFLSQFDETCENLLRLLRQPQLGCQRRQPLASFRELRAYLVKEDDRKSLIDSLAVRFPGLERLETMPADLCRSELLVEVEGIVESS
jgi:hypothetical protein